MSLVEDQNRYSLIIDEMFNCYNKNPIISVQNSLSKTYLQLSMGIPYKLFGGRLINLRGFADKVILVGYNSDINKIAYKLHLSGETHFAHVTRSAIVLPPPDLSTKLNEMHVWQFTPEQIEAYELSKQTRREHFLICKLEAKLFRNESIVTGQFSDYPSITDMFKKEDALAVKYRELIDPIYDYINKCIEEQFHYNPHDFMNELKRCNNA